jgi:uncharacterized protein (TIGR01777 family)
MKILITGSNGLIGSHLLGGLVADGHHILRLVRHDPRNADEIAWDPAAGALDPGRLNGVDAVIHLAGESIKGRWTASKRNAILDSRVRGTSLLAMALADMPKPPRAFLCASAAAYGDRGNEVLTEASEPGRGFLADVCRAWEAATLPAAQKGIRTVNLRFSLVLDSGGGALASMLTPFRLGLGGRIGNGRQYWSWIHIEDAVGALKHVLVTESLTGPVNIVSPNPATNRQFTQALGRALGRLTVLPVPAAVMRLVLGQMADELLLASVRAAPQKLLESGFTFRHPEVAEALRAILQR